MTASGEDERLVCGDPPTLFATYTPGEATVLTVGTKAWCRSHGWQEVEHIGSSVPGDDQ